MRRLMFLLALAMASPALAQTFPERGRAAVVDAAGVIPDAKERMLNDHIVSWVKANGPQLAVVTVPSLEGRDIKDYSNRLFRKWGLGQGKDGSAQSNGVLLLLAPAERKVRIEVGYGLEPILTDALTSQIIRDHIVPELKANNIPAALEAGVGALMVAAKPTAENPAPVVRPSGQRSMWPWVLGALLSGVCVLGGFLVTRANRRRQEEAEAEARRRRSSYRVHSDTSGHPTETLIRRAAEASSAPSRYSRPSAPPTSPAPSRRRDEDDYSSRSSYSSYSSPTPSSSDYGSSSSSSSSYDNSSSSSGYDSGGGSSGGGGSDSSY